MKNALALSLLLALSPTAAHAQFGETVEVRITNVETIVTDKAGKPVSGLTKDDFEVYENGVLQQLSNFAEVRQSVPAGTLTQGEATPAEAAAPDMRRRVIAIFVDNATVELANRNGVLPELKRFLREGVRPGDAVVIYTWGNSLKSELEPSSDPAEIEAAMGRVSKRVVPPGSDWRAKFEEELHELIDATADLSPREGMSQKPSISEAISLASSYADRNSAEMRQKGEAIKSVIASLRGTDARKVLVLLTQSLDTNPGEAVFNYIDALRESFSGSFIPASEARLYELPQLATDIAAAANSAGVTLYPINLAGKFTDMTMRDASSKIRVTSRPVDTTQTSTANLFTLAANTGGIAAAGSSNWKLVFDTIANDLNVYYSLGYRTDGARQDRVKNVEVRLKKKGYTVRTRKAIVEQTAATEMNDRVAANLFHANFTNDLNIRAGVGTAAPAGENLVHPLTVTIPTSTLTLIPDGTDLVGKFSVFATFLRSDGAVSSVARQTQQFRFPAASLAKRKEVTVKLDVTADARVDTISLGVMDEVSSATGFALVKLPPATGNPQGSTE
jgi:VWFA-related protein